MTTLARDVVLQVSTQLQDLNPQFRRWPEAEMIRVANYAQIALAKYLPQISSRTDSIKLAAGSRQDLSRVLAANIIPGDGSAPADTYGIAFKRMLCNMGDTGTTIGPAVRGAVDRYLKDAFEPNWQSTTGTAVSEVVFDKDQPLQFWCSPAVPASPAMWARIEWLALPARLPDGGTPGAEKYVAAGSESTRVLSVPDAYAEDVVNYCIAVLALKGSKNTQNMAKAQLHAGLFVQSINAQAQVTGGASPNLKVLSFIAEATSK